MWRVVMARLSIPPSPCRGELDWLWGPTCTRAERGRGREGLGAWALVGEDGKVCARDCVECGEGHAASGALRMLRWSVVRAGSKHEELSSMHTRMSDLAWARVFRKPFRRPITFTRAARSGPAPHVRRSASASSSTRRRMCSATEVTGTSLTIKYLRHYSTERRSSTARDEKWRRHTIRYEHEPPTAKPAKTVNCVCARRCCDSARVSLP